MKRYIRVYRLLLLLNLKSLLVYPVNFYNSVVATLAWGFFSLYSIVLLTGSTNGAFGLTRNEILLLNGVYGILIGIFHVLFSYNFGRFSSVIHRGQLDSILIKPIDSQFLLSFWMFGWVNLSRIVMSAAYVIFLIYTLHIQVTIGNLVQFLLLSICSIILLYSIWYIVVTSTIWFTRLSNLAELMFNITGIARYPRAMIAGPALLFLLPFILIINVPTKALFYSAGLQDSIILVMLTCITLYSSRLFWRFALRYYTSAST